MTDFQTLRKIEKIEMLFNTAKAFAISFGANEESFAEADAKLKELKDDFLKRVSGGIYKGELEQYILSGEWIAAPGLSNITEQSKEAKFRIICDNSDGGLSELFEMLRESHKEKI
jgi:hypothetical protein